MKSKFYIQHITKQQAYNLLITHHYLSRKSKNFRSGYNYGLFCDVQLVGVAIFHGISVPEILQGAFKLQRNQQEGFFELGRFCLDPSIQQQEHNIASWFLSRAIKLLRQNTCVRAILSYADSAFHVGTLYQAINFKYYGLTAPRSDFWILQPDGSYIQHQRGPTKHLIGKWLPRSRKHRYLLIFDPSLKVYWQEQPYPKRCTLL